MERKRGDNREWSIHLTQTHTHKKEPLIVLVGFDRLLLGIMKEEIKLEENKKLVLNEKLKTFGIHEYGGKMA